MNKREKIMAIATVAAVVGYLGIEMIPSGEAGPTGDVESAQANYEQTIEDIITAPEVYVEFYQLVGTDTKMERENEEGYDPDLVFSEDITRWANQVGFPQPRFDTEVEDIRGPDNEIVEDYQLLVMTLNIPEGDLSRIAQLLKTFESNGLIIQMVNLNARPDKKTLSADITVARLVQAFKNTPARIRAGTART